MVKIKMKEQCQNRRKKKTEWKKWNTERKKCRKKKLKRSIERSNEVRTNTKKKEVKWHSL